MKQSFSLLEPFTEDSSPIPVKYKIDGAETGDLTLLEQAGQLHCFNLRKRCKHESS
jgi:hypothetical protein